MPVLTAKATTRHGTAKRSFIPTAFVLLVIVGVAVVFLALGHDDGKGTLASQTSKASGSDGSSSQDGYHPSDEIIDPYAISKNPYLLKGHSGILDTVHVFVQMGNERVPIGYPGGALTFNKMLDEHTATYQVRGGSNPQFPDAEIAVILPDSNPPDTRKMWRIFVEGTIDGINALGAPLQISAIRFEGYYVQNSQPTQPSAANAVNSSVASPGQTAETSEQTDEGVPNGLWGTWSIVRSLPVGGVSACDETLDKKLIGTQLGYSPTGFRWNNTAISNPKTKSEVVTANDLLQEDKVRLSDLGISASSTKRISFEHSDADITGATVEIPGDSVFLNDQNELVFSVCNHWFEAHLVTAGVR